MSSAVRWSISSCGKVVTAACVGDVVSRRGWLACTTAQVSSLPIVCHVRWVLSWPVCYNAKDVRTVQVNSWWLILVQFTAVSWTCRCHRCLPIRVKRSPTCNGFPTTWYCQHSRLLPRTRTSFTLITPIAVLLYHCTFRQWWLTAVHRRRQYRWTHSLPEIATSATRVNEESWCYARWCEYLVNNIAAVAYWRTGVFAHPCTTHTELVFWWKSAKRLNGAVCQWDDRTCKSHVECEKKAACRACA